jgi:hypothetical protein
MGVIIRLAVGVGVVVLHGVYMIYIYLILYTLFHLLLEIG